MSPAGASSGPRSRWNGLTFLLGDVLGGGGLTLVYDEENDQLLITEQRGDWHPFVATTLTRIDANASPGPSPSASASL